MTRAGTSRRKQRQHIGGDSTLVRRQRPVRARHCRTIALLAASALALHAMANLAWSQARGGGGTVGVRVGPPPLDLAVTGDPASATLSWQPTAGATSYAVERWFQSDPICCRTAPAVLPATTTKWFDDLGATMPAAAIYGTYVYRVTVFHGDGTQGMADANFTRPVPQKPAGFTATHRGLGQVDFQWQAVPGAVQYRLDGPGFPAIGYHLTSTSTRASTPAGASTWKVTPLYYGNHADYKVFAEASAVVRFLPSHPGTWLSRNGVGSHSDALAHMYYECGYVMDCTPFERKMRLGAFGLSFWGDPSKASADAVYGNAGDLGVGRRTNCAQGVVGPPAPRFVSICYSTSHGPGPGEVGFGDPAVMTWAAAGGIVPTSSGSSKTWFDPWGLMPRGGTIIAIDQSGATFLAFTPGTNAPPPPPDWYLSSWDFALRPVAVSASVFDTEGPKFVPHSCIACHGGRYNASTKRVEGASLLPLDPALLVFGGPPGDRQSQEENIRRINLIVATSSPSMAVKNYINGLYNGAVASPGARTVSDYVPAGWAPQTGFYRSVVRPYCAMCHLAAPASVSFSSWSNFQQNAPAIHTAVCKVRTMPHAEIAFKEFWLKDTGALFLPGLLAATLGFPSC